MKSVFSIAAAIAASVLACAAAAQTTAVPKHLAGKWNTPDSSDGQRVIVEINTAKRTGSLSLTFADQRCTIRAAPMALSMLGARVTLKSTDAFSNECVDDMTLEMVPNAGPKGEVGYLGELRVSGPAANRAPILRGRLTPP